MNPRLEPGRSETFPYAERFAEGASAHGAICYFDEGTARDLPPLVFLHALGTNLTHWEYVAPQLSLETRVVGLDLIGCGHSARASAPYSLGMMREAVLGLLNHLGMRRAVFVGHSFGGRIAVDLALRAPERAAGLVLINPSGFTRFPWPLRAAARRVARPWLLSCAIRYGIGAVWSHIFATRGPRVERFIHQAESRPDYAYLRDFADYACPLVDDLTSDVLEELGGLSAPTLFVCGDRDALIRPEGARRSARAVPGARLVLLEGCGHMPNIEQPEAVCEAIAAFLGSLEPRAVPAAAQ